MRPILTRFQFTDTSTVGNLIVPDTTFQCFTLEDVARALGVKLFGKTAIPAGIHKCRVSVSPRFKRALPLIYNRPDQSLNDGHGAQWVGIRMHNGVNHLNTEGCILTGHKVNESFNQLAGPCADELTKLLIEKFGMDTEFEIEIINKQAR
jgi:hypothetical protein